MNQTGGVTHAASYCEGVLIVDDDEGIRSALTQALQDEGYRVMAAEDGAQALDVLRATQPPPCLVLLDMMMPVLDGRGFLRQKQNEPSFRDVPVVVVTADRRALRDAATLSAAEVLAKPISLDRLLRAVQRFCP